ncbi:hypothetical protein Sipo8835_12365 [Streptomyces ipomoeae]|jgi:hypothetical protein|uniref:Secreted protein n=2 Tax=Streptomyces ipomoeae TaxID=103232 RepID=L1KHP8_9ACTN|nr:hypothetical protein [Streptomyces ipomoeae]EKX60306.1 hypothetical protein STRIP9103_02528 [Streptomyces ipomoeae 91-03]MDX2694155.1 hypothetical protein [Streptomyces ipomoeae]MDX2821564.1 hypothetical protein [Streptomyces ipomoeae]MDX2840269.1 hypothetical protein [Streptomyces ipomoeae]MDX2873113.1 hypothetical protein [Streptomyces ipomoeae]
MRRWTAVAAASATVLLFGANSASASPTMNWKEVSTNDSWVCSSYVTHVDKPGVKFKACIVTNLKGHSQAVLVVQNVSGSAVTIDGRIVFDSQEGGDAWCASSTLNSGFTRGCFGPTVKVCKAHGDAVVTLGVNGKDDTTRREWDFTVICG